MSTQEDIKDLPSTKDSNLALELNLKDLKSELSFPDDIRICDLNIKTLSQHSSFRIPGIKLHTIYKIKAGGIRRFDAAHP